MKNSYISQNNNKKHSEKVAFFFSFTKFFKVWLQKKQLEFYRFTDCFSMQSVTMWCFGFGLGRKSASCRRLVGKGTKSFNSLFNNCGYS